ncbi:hypothetical protein HDR61_01770 [bacterium]|nr:hypothetical protein [bacterium]
MALKPRTFRKIFIGVCAMIAIIATAIITIPPMFTLNKLKPEIQAAITAQTGVPAQINGDVHFSLIGATTIVARDITIPDGHIGAASFRVPLGALFDLSRARLDGRIGIYDANVSIARLTPANGKYDIELHNCNVTFLGKEYKIITGTMNNNEFHAIVRTNQHKYDITLNGDAFYVTNKNNNLVITGNLTENGGARGTMSLHAIDVNKMFEFDEPKIPDSLALDMKFDWDGEYGVLFSDITAPNFSGNIDIAPDGARSIEIKSDDITFDFSFLLHPTNIMRDMSFNLNLRGHLTLGNRNFSRLIIRAVAHHGILKIDRIVADDTVISGGEISSTGAKNLMISTKLDGQTATCIFNGTPQKWSCEKFSYRDMTGNLAVDGDTFNVSVTSSGAMPSDNEIRDMTSILGRRGMIKFIFNDAAGTMNIDGKKIQTDFKFARDKTLGWLRGASNFIPEFMRDEIGDFALSANRVTFRPHSGRWELTTEGDAFAISGTHLYDWFPDMDLTAINDGEYFVSGIRRGDNISNLTVRFLGHEFIGSATGKNITLKTDTLNIDSFIKQEFIDNYSEMEFLTDSPIMLPFDLPVNISLSAETLIYNGDEYKNFVFSLKNNTQTYSISDQARGRALAIITRDKKKYEISIQMNKFKTSGMLLAGTMPLNIRDTTITGETIMQTSGQIAHDLEYNMVGTLDFVFSGGTLVGIGIDEFYGAAENITTFNAEYAIAAALDGGETALKEMRIRGEFERGDFHTTEPATISMRHATATGNIEIQDDKMTADLDVTMRATSPSPTAITLDIYPDGSRSYSLSEIMRNFDAGFMRQFIKTHTKF